jgi:hypothetical protein
MENEATAIAEPNQDNMEELRKRIISRMSLTEIFQLLEEKINKAMNDSREVKELIEELDLERLKGTIEALDPRELEMAMNTFNDYDFDQFITGPVLDDALSEIGETADDAYSRVDDIESTTNEIWDKLNKIEEEINSQDMSEGLQVEFEGFKEELESLSQRQDLMDERIGRFERLYNVFRLAMSNDPK